MVLGACVNRYAHHHGLHQHSSSVLQISSGKMPSLSSRFCGPVTCTTGLPKLCFKTKPVEMRNKVWIWGSLFLICLFILQVQIYELEEHKIETWRGFYNMPKTTASCIYLSYIYGLKLLFHFWQKFIWNTPLIDWSASLLIAGETGLWKTIYVSKQI